jgi:hypothetical protein
MEKTFLIAIGAVVGVGFLLRNKMSGGSSDVASNSSDPYHNDTVYIPTSEYNLHYVAGNETSTVYSNTDNTTVTGGVVNGGTKTGDDQIKINDPVVFPKTITLTARTSAFSKPDKTTTPITSFTPQTVKAKAKQGEWYLIQSYKGDVWIIPNYEKVKITTPTDTGGGNKPATNFTYKLTWKTSIFANPNIDDAPLGYLAPQTVTVLAQQNGMYQINSWKGKVWIKPNFYKTEGNQKLNIVEGYKEYDVKAGDTLSSIAKNLTGDSSNYIHIAEENYIQNPNIITPGQHLIIY